MQGLPGSYRWDWKELRAALPGLAVAWIPDLDGDLTGPGIAIDETAQLKHGDATACVAPQHAGCTGKAENCVTTVFSAYVTADGQAWADFDVDMPDRWARDFTRRRAAGVPDDLQFATKPQLATRQLGRLTTAGLPGQDLLIRRLISRPDQMTFCLCWAPPGRPATMTYFITIAGRRWPVEETFKTGKDVLGWDQSQARTWDGATSATLTCRYPSATRPSRIAAGSPARQESPPSSYRSPRPPGSPASPGSTPPG